MSYFKRDKRAYLLLEDGTVFEGYNMGVEGTAVGELVFNTGMTGYQETLTDPSFYGQIVMQTYPLVGNYGVNDDDMQSERSWVNGLIVREWCGEPSNFRATATIHDFLVRQKKVGIWDIDTRALTKILRDKGSMRGAITTQDIKTQREILLKRIKNPQTEDMVAAVTCDKKGWFYTRENRANHVALIDYGYRKAFLNILLDLGCNVTLMPAQTDLDDIRELNPDGIFLSNGPGDPRSYDTYVRLIKSYLDYGKPIFGIGLGHQLLALAKGAEVTPLHHGHRGFSHPVQCVATGRVYMTHQNHGYTVAADSLPANVGKVTHVHLHDKSCEAIEYAEGYVFSTEFYPQITPCPNSTGFFFERFNEFMERGQQGCL